MSWSRRGNVKVVIIVIMIVLGVLGLLCAGVMALAFPALVQARLAARRANSQNNLKQIGLALHNYHDTFGTLPPAYIPDEDGKPMHSWRVLILPFMEQGAAYDRYDFSQPWDSPQNLELAKMLEPYMYTSFASDDDVESGMTPIVALAGPDTMITTENAAAFRDVTNGISNTICVVELPGQEVYWSEPIDVAPDVFLKQDFDDNNYQGVNVLMGDASVRFLQNSDKPEVGDMLSRTSE
ncbi:DUF1559 domain-containing protein [Bremerella sp. T1]|uniref:DUF1559 domain-containing protein n=1 Tax=Bremerella sp. TYQ1 TaxID=3119568 RepID=UPI001CCE3E3A|nr:DUF1559 domain-containing protein [Bremerella volcania]UBM34728.1 DUF1559 domain-containing protein [Bremerella volcania]